MLVMEVIMYTSFNVLVAYILNGYTTFFFSLFWPGDQLHIKVGVSLAAKYKVMRGFNIYCTNERNPSGHSD
jgi:hypothetical protein